MLRWSLAAVLLAAAPLSAAQTAAEDEARIEELIRREQAVRQVAAQRDAAPATGADAGAADTIEPDADVAAHAAPAPAATAEPAVPSAESDGEIAALAEPDPTAPIADTDALGGDDWPPPDPKAIAIADLGAHVGKAVRVRSLGGRTRVGRIESVGDAGVTLVSPMGGGYAKYTLPYSQITRVERL